MPDPFDQLGERLSTDGGPSAPVRIPATTAAAVVIKNSPGRLCRVINPTGVAIAQSYKFYDDPNGNANKLIFTWVPGATDILNVQIFCANGITVIPSASTSGDVLVEVV